MQCFAEQFFIHVFVELCLLHNIYVPLITKTVTFSQSNKMIKSVAECLNCWLLHVPFHAGFLMLPFAGLVGGCQSKQNITAIVHGTPRPQCSPIYLFSCYSFCQSQILHPIHNIFTAATHNLPFFVLGLRLPLHFVQYSFHQASGYASKTLFL